VICKIKYKK